ncbi:CoA-binding protein [archaeon]|nr:CoA-binding protein [archaeon]
MKKEIQKKIIIVGASADRQKFGNKAVRAYRQSGWKVYPVNPHETEIEGLKCFAKATDVPVKTDLASIYLPPSIGLTIVDDLKAKGIKHAYLNPGSESPELVEALQKAGIEPWLACSILAIGLDPKNF